MQDHKLYQLRRPANLRDWPGGLALANELEVGFRAEVESPLLGAVHVDGGHDLDNTGVHKEGHHLQLGVHHDLLNARLARSG